MKRSFLRLLFPLLLAAALLFSSCSGLIPEEARELLGLNTTESAQTAETAAPENVTLSSIPSYQDKAYVAVNGNIPFFTEEEKAKAANSYEVYSELDALGRCGVAESSVGKDIMPTENRGSIGSVKPSGWQTVKYDIVDGGYLYNRCHLIGYQLTGENANKQNLITGTRYLNIDGMLEFENMVADYVKETNNHVLYRVTPIFKGDDLVALGVLMEGWSVEDDGDGVCFCVFSYNVQPGIVINYADGTSRLAEEGEELLTMWGGDATEEPATSETGEAGSGTPEQTLAPVSIPETVALGGKATVTVRGKANTEYSIRVTLPSGSQSKAAGLETKTSDENGTVTWEWTVASGTKAGEVQVSVTGGGETLNASFHIGEAPDATEAAA